MSTLRTIITATDFSAPSRHAAQRAAREPALPISQNSKLFQVTACYCQADHLLSASHVYTLAGYGPELALDLVGRSPGRFRPPRRPQR